MNHSEDEAFDPDNYEALQWMQLTWGYPRFKAQFDAQNAHLREIINACYSQLRLPELPPDVPHFLCLRRRVFRGVCSQSSSFWTSN